MKPDTLPPGVARHDCKGMEEAVYGRWLHVSDLPAIKTHWLEQLKEELLRERAIEAAKDELHPPPGDYLRNFHVRKAIVKALDSLTKEGDSNGG